MSKAATAPAPSALGRFWYRWRFHLNVLLVLIPLGFMPKYFQDVALFRGDSGLGERTVDVQINRLRRKIETDPGNPIYLQTVRGIGYRLACD